VSVCGVCRLFLLMVVPVVLPGGTVAAWSPERLGQLLGAARGCGDGPGLAALAACLERFSADDGVRERLRAAADTAQRSPWLERPGVCARARIAVRALALWKTRCRDLGPPRY